MTMMKTIGLWFRIVRPQTLAASLCPVMAALIAMPSPVTSATVAAVTIVCALALQILSNLINSSNNRSLLIFIHSLRLSLR